MNLMLKILCLLILNISTNSYGEDSVVDYAQYDSKFRFAIDLSLPSGAMRDVPLFRGKISEYKTDVYSCALDEKSLQCWTEPYPSQSMAPTTLLKIDNLINPRNLALRYDRVCLINNQLLNCWELDNRRPSAVNEVALPKNLINPENVSLGVNTTCAVDEEVVKCWKDDLKVSILDQVNKPKQLLSTNTHSCALSDQGISCWKNPIHGNYSENRFVAKLINLSHGSVPEKIYLTPEAVCGIYENILKCRSIKDVDSDTDANDVNHIVEGKLDTLAINDVLACIAKNTTTVSCFNIFDQKSKPLEYDRYQNPTILNITRSGNSEKRCVVEDKGLNCYNQAPLRVTGGGDIPATYNYILIPHNLKTTSVLSIEDNGTCAVNDKGQVCWFAKSFYPSFSEERIPDGIKVEGANQIYIGRENVNCFMGPADFKCYQYGRVLYALEMNDLIRFDGHCGLNKYGDVKCVDFQDYKKIKEISLDPSSFFHSEKSIPLAFANQVLFVAEDTPKSVASLFVLREKIVQSFLKGMNTESANLLLKNSAYLEKYLLSTKKISNLSERNTLQLRYIIDVMAHSLNSSKYLLSLKGKQTVDVLNIEFANVLSKDFITQEEANKLIDLTLEQSKLMAEMQGSHRLVGVSSYWMWAKKYVSTGLLD